MNLYTVVVVVVVGALLGFISFMPDSIIYKKNSGIVVIVVSLIFSGCENSDL